MALQAAEVLEGPHVVTSGTASVDATPDIATPAIEVSVSQRRRPAKAKRVAQYLISCRKQHREERHQRRQPAHPAGI